jgi:hypothetical protein
VSTRFIRETPTQCPMYKPHEQGLMKRIYITRISLLLSYTYILTSATRYGPMTQMAVQTTIALSTHSVYGAL